MRDSPGWSVSITANSLSVEWSKIAAGCERSTPPGSTVLTPRLRCILPFGSRTYPSRSSPTFCGPTGLSDLSLDATSSLGRTLVAGDGVATEILDGFFIGRCSGESAFGFLTSHMPIRTATREIRQTPTGNRAFLCGFRHSCAVPMRIAEMPRSSSMENRLSLESASRTMRDCFPFLSLYVTLQFIVHLMN